ncbi:MAG: hypothetical protein Q9217_000980 [Psora testacea]
MDRGRSLRHENVPSASTSNSTGSTSSTTRLKPAAGLKAEPVKRKPVPGSATSSPATTQQTRPLPLGAQELSRHQSAQQSFLLQGQPSLPAVSTSSPAIIPRNLDEYPRGFSPQSPPASQNSACPPTTTEYQDPYPRARLSRQASESRVNDATKIKRVPVNPGLQRAISLHPTGRPTETEDGPADPAMITKTPRSPGPNKLTSFFGWKTSPTHVAETSPTSYSDRSHSPGPSPLPPSPRSMASSAVSIPNGIDITKANARSNGAFFAETGFPVPPLNGLAIETTAHVEDLEEELKEVSAELAGSIRREMELEDLVDRLQLEASQGPDLGRRTSDYFSDSGSGSIRYPTSDTGVNKSEDLAKQKRISEQEKAQFKLNLSHKLQDERRRRKVLEAHIQQLSEQMQNVDEERAISSDVANRIRDLESALENHRRRLQEEKRDKENFEDLLTALRGEISQYRDERDNLRDEVVPQLKARIEGLEGEAAEFQKLTYDNARMQQELQSLKNENTTLMNARRLQLEMQQHSTRFNAIAEEEDSSPPAISGLGLTRSMSTRGAGGLGRSPSLKRSNSLSSKEREFNERVKDIEMQRDALHKALKLLLDRQNYQNREHEKRAKTLKAERDRALQNQSPRRMGYEREVDGLKYEINHFRRRADEAIQQKYQCEKGLGGLKKDLDRAEQETTSLRALLQENDILIPERPESLSHEVENGAHATSASLEKAYKDLQRTQAMSITKLRELHGGAPSSAEDAETQITMEKLLKSMSDAEAEQDFAQKQAAIFRAEADSLKEAENLHSGENAGLADQLRAAANRVEILSEQVRTQLDSNSNLRQRLAEAVGRGEREQKNSTARINSMQGILKTLEDKLMTAQQHSEEAFAQHEEEVKEIKESHNAQLQRLKSGVKLRTPSAFSPRTPGTMSPIFYARSPKLDRTTSGTGKSLDEALRTEFLEKKVVELEGALGEADKEMEEVVSRMNLAQIEVMELQSARDEAMRETRKLQAAVHAEREKVASLMK